MLAPPPVYSMLRCMMNPSAPMPAISDSAEPFDYLTPLNPEQRQAVEALDGPVLVLAGAGTGKTRVLTTRLAHLVHSKKAFTGQILAVTFTNKAAREMRERVEGLLGAPAAGMWLGTFHAIGVRILRRHAALVGLDTQFTVLDTDDQIRLVKQVLVAQAIDEKKFPAKVFLSIIQGWKDRGLKPSQVNQDDVSSFADGRSLKVYRDYQARLGTLNACDFGDLLLYPLTIFLEHPDLLKEYGTRFHYILVDEYQDTNIAQYLLLRLLAQTHRNICCVGDDDQSIYSWRGAEVGNILKFEQDFPGAAIIRLERNYRSTGHILGAAGALIAHNQGRLGKTLWTEDANGEKVRIRGLWDDMAEARHIGEEIEALQRNEKLSLTEMAILVRAGYQTRAFEEIFMQMAIPYRVVGGLRFYERLEVRDALAYLRVIAQPDDGLAFERILNTPKRGLGKAAVETMHRKGREQNISLYRAAEDIIAEKAMKGRGGVELAKLLEKFTRWRQLAETLPHPELAELVLEESGYIEMWKQDRSPEAAGRLDNLKELVRAMQEFDTLPQFLEHVALVADNNTEGGEKDEGQVSLMTLHAAKGLEFHSVFLAGWEEGLFPSPRHLEEKGAAGLEEERRLAYVGITRARHRCTITHAANRRVYGQWQTSIPSRFLDELPAEHTEEESDVRPSAARRPEWQDPAALFASTQQRFRNRSEPEPAAASSPAASPHGPDLAPGRRVFHQKFGYGKVRKNTPAGLVIDFDHTGEKQILPEYVTPA